MIPNKAHITMILCMLVATSSSLDAFRRRGYKKVTKEAKTATAFALQSSAFARNGDIPEEYACDGRDVSPPLRWEHAPKGTKSFALLCEDPDAVGGKVWVHWILFNIPANVHDLPAGVQASSIGAVEGTTSWRAAKYGGPCPPLKKHRYVFTVYALNVPKLQLTTAAKRSAVKGAMKGHILGKAVLIGRYQRPKNRAKKSR